MDDDKKGKEFLKLIDDQNTVQWNIVAKLSSLIKAEYKITKDLNNLDNNNSIL